MVGRHQELARLRSAYDGVLRSSRASLVVVSGEAGIGKSRLVQKFLETIGPPHTALIGNCRAYGEGITFWPLREIIMQAAGGRRTEAIEALFDDPPDARAAARIAAAVGLTDELESSTELFRDIRHLFEGLARTRPVVAVFEDVHWAEPTLLDLIVYLVGTLREPVLLVCVARPEIFESRAAWSHDAMVNAVIALDPLDVEDSRALIAQRLGTPALRPATMRRVVDTGGGNPFFLEQMLAAMRHGDDEVLPASVRALLVARIDRLGPAERDLLRCAAIVGTEFPLAALTALVPERAHPFLDRHLRSLVDRELVCAAVSSFLDGPTFAFRHVLIQLAAYRSMTRRDRAELHERFADWLEDHAARERPEVEEVIGHHLEQAWDQRRSIGLDDRHSQGLAERAGERLATAGLRAYAHLDVSAAANLLSRAKELLPSRHPRRYDALRRLPEIHQMLGQHAEADAVLAERLERAEDHADRERIRLEQLRIQLFTGPDPTSLDSIQHTAGQALNAFADGEQDALASLAAYVLWMVHIRRGEVQMAEQVAWKELERAERSGDVREEAAARWTVAVALVDGPRPVPDCLRVCDDLVRWRGGEHFGVQAELARLRAMLGEPDVARRLIDDAQRQLVEKMRARRPLMFVTQRAGEIELLAGNAAAAVPKLRRALETATEIGERSVAAQLAATLSRVLPIGAEETAHLAARSAALAPSEDVVAQALSRHADTRTLMGDGNHRAAERQAQAAIGLVPAELLNLRADLHVGLADVVSATGRSRDARTYLRRAVALYERKGNVAAAGLATAKLR